MLILLMPCLHQFDGVYIWLPNLMWIVHYRSVVFCENKCNGTMNLLNAAKTIWKDNMKENVFTISVPMRCMAV
jgi:hypothetical protein